MKNLILCLKTLISFNTKGYLSNKVCGGVYIGYDGYKYLTGLKLVCIFNTKLKQHKYIV